LTLNVVREYAYWLCASFTKLRISNRGRGDIIKKIACHITVTIIAKPLGAEIGPVDKENSAFAEFLQKGEFLYASFTASISSEIFTSSPTRTPPVSNTAFQVSP